MLFFIFDFYGTPVSARGHQQSQCQTVPGRKKYSSWKNKSLCPLHHFNLFDWDLDKLNFLRERIMLGKKLIALQNSAIFLQKKMCQKNVFFLRTNFYCGLHSKTHLFFLPIFFADFFFAKKNDLSCCQSTKLKWWRRLTEWFILSPSRLVHSLSNYDS